MTIDKEHPMTTTLTPTEADQLALPGLEPTNTGCTIAADATPATVAEALRRLDQRTGTSNWWVGDLNLEVLLRVRAGDRDWEQVAPSLDQAHTARCVRVAAVFPPERRHAALSWSHHDLVAAMGVGDQDRLLTLAAAEELTRDQLKALVVQEREDTAPRLDNMPLRPWKPPATVARRVAEIAAVNPGARVVVDLATGDVAELA